MSTVNLYGTDIFGEDVAGTGAIWNDDNDATYATTIQGSRAGAGTLDQLMVPAAKVANIALVARISATGPTLEPAQMEWLPDWDSSPFTVFPNTYPATFFLVTPDGATRDYEVPIDPAHLTTVAEGLSNPTHLWRSLDVAWSSNDPDYTFPAPGTYTATIREAWLTVTYGATHAPPLRQYPRSDGLAVSSARRMWPPPRSYQRGIRRAGGYL